jgi:hemolysin III
LLPTFLQQSAWPSQNLNADITSGGEMSSSMNAMPVWIRGEEFVNSLTHGIGAVLAAIASFFLIRKAVRSQSVHRLVGNIVFSLSMVELYTASAVYHGLLEGPAKRVMRFVDHCSIFGLIAGSYTPITLVTLRQHGGYIVLAIAWALVALGTFGKILYFDLIEPYAAHLYVAMGWLAIFTFRAMIKNMTRKGLFWLLAGGISYTAGCYFFIVEKPFWHAIFHCFIMGGTFCHVIAIGKYT